MKGSNETGVGGQMIDGNISANGTRVVDSDVVIAKIEKVTNQTGFLPSKNESAAIGTDTKVLKYAEAILKANQTPTADYLGDDLMSELKPIEAKDANGKPRNLTIQEQIENKKRETILQEKVKELKELKDAGFGIIKSVGEIFPGIDPVKVDAAMARKNGGQNQKEADLEKIEPIMTVNNILSEGKVEFVFNTPIMFPVAISTNTMRYVVVFGLISQDGTTTFGRIINKEDLPATNSSRLLESENVDKSFFVTIEAEESQKLVFKLHFVEKAAISRIARDTLQINIRRPQIFKSAYSLKPVKIPEKDQRGFVLKFVPPQIDAASAAAIQDSVDKAQTAVQAVTVGNFIVQTLFSGSMQQLWGMIRSMQFIVLSFMIRVPVPGLTFFFFEHCSQIASMDIFDGSSLYQNWFNFTESDPPSETFSMAGFDTQNFLVNSGSYFIIMTGLICINLGYFVLNSVAKYFAKIKLFRQVGMRVYSENYISDTKNQITKLVLETHFEITMCAVLGMIQITQLDQATGSRFTPFFIYSSDQINSLLSMFHLVWMVVFPSYFTYRLVTQFHCLDQDKTREELEFLLEENKHDSRMRALYQVFFMSRRFLSVMVLVFMTDWPFFQCSFLMIFSTINLVYLIAHLPLLTNFENILNFINELSIVIFSHMMTNLLNPNIPESLFDSLGKGLISVVAINILINFIAIASQSIQSLLVEHRKKAAVLKIKQRFAARQKARQKLQQEFGMEFGHFNEYQQQLEALEFCREWKQHQKWLVKNKVKVDGFKEQEIYQQHLKTLNLITKAKLQQKGQVIKQAIGKETAAEIEKIRSLLIQNQRAIREANWGKVVEVIVKNHVPKRKPKKSSINLKNKQNIHMVVEESNEEDSVVEQADNLNFQKPKFYLNEKNDLTEKHKEFLFNEVSSRFKQKGLLKQFDHDISEGKTFEKFLKKDIQDIVQKMDEEENEQRKKILKEILNIEIDCIIPEQQTQFEAKVFKEMTEDLMNMNFLIKDSEQEEEDDESKKELETKFFQQTTLTAKEVLIRLNKGIFSEVLTDDGRNGAMPCVMQCLLNITVLARFLLLSKLNKADMKKKEVSFIQLINEVIIDYFQTPQLLANSSETQSNSFISVKELRHHLQNKSKKQDLNSCKAVIVSIFKTLKDEVGPNTIDKLFLSKVSYNQVCTKNHKKTFDLESYFIELPAGVQIMEYISMVVGKMGPQMECKHKNCGKNLIELQGSITEAPKVLIVVFEIASLLKIQEISSPIPENIDLTQLTKSNQSTLYELSGVISLRSDSTKKNPTYDAFVRKHARVDDAKQWFKYSRDCQFKASCEEVLGSKCHIAFYFLI